MGLVVSEKKIFLVFSNRKSMKTIDPMGVAKFDPRGMAGTIYVKDHWHCHIPNIKAVGPVISEKIFYFFPIVRLWRLSTPRAVAKFDPRGMNGTIYVEDH